MSYFRPEIEAMAGYAPGEQPQDGEFIKLNTNENPYPPSPAVARAIEETIPRLKKYPDPTAGAFRRRAAEVLGVDPDWILCGNGSDDILTIVTRTFVGQGQLLRLPYPSYILYKTLAELQGARAEEVQFNPDWTLPAAFSSGISEGDSPIFVGRKLRQSPLASEGDNSISFGQKLGQSPRLVFLANPNSPSGTVVSPQQVLEIAERLPCPLLVDEAYADFAETNCMSLVARCEKIMVARTLSKSYALAGLRFGYVVAQPKIIEQLMKMKDSYNCDALAIAAATAAIGDQEWRAANRAKILATRNRLTSEMRKLGFVTVDSQANFVWNTHPSLPARPLYERLKQQRILVRYMNYPAWGDGLRISVGKDEEITALLEKLKEGLGIGD